MKTLITLSALIILTSCNNNPDTNSLLTNGVSQKLAVFRYQQVSDVFYDLSFEIPLKKEDSILSELNLSLSIHDLSQPVYLDFKQNKEFLLSIFVNEKEIPIIHEKEHIVISAENLTIGKNIINIKFIAGEMSLNRNEDYLYTLLVPDRARTFFPCFDQPDIKSYFALKITTPKDWVVLCGSPLEFKKEKGDYIQYQFRKTDMMSTYLFSFVAGNFKTVNNNSTIFNMQMLYRETNPEKLTTSTNTIFNLHKQSIDYLENYTDYKFPFQKFDFVTIPGFQYGGMEHVGAIQYRESSLFLDSSATQNQELDRAKLIAHETSHMWFGNLVTMKWFEDVWLKEVFANLMADKIVNPAFPKINHDLQFLTGHYPRAYSIDRSRGTNPIRQDLDNLNNAGSLYGNIIYDKAPIMMRQLEATLGKTTFQEGIIEYIKRFANKNAEWNDLVEIFDKKTSLDMKQWSNVWVNSTGRPIIKGSISYSSDNKIQSFQIEQEAEDGSDKIWPQLFDVSLVYPDTTIIVSINLNEKNITISSAIGLSKPDLIIYNSNGFGYGVFPIEKDKLDNIPIINDIVARGHSYINCFENTLNGNISPEKALDLFQEGLVLETNELILHLISSELRSIYWHYLTKSQRIEHQAPIEEILFERLMLTATPSMKKTLFDLFKSIAYSDLGVDRLYDIWSKNLVIPNLILNEDDYTDLAMLLAVYEHSEAEGILDKAKKDISNPDKLKRFEFLLPSLSNDEQVGERFFESFREEENRAKENWVLSACYYIHHPLRQKTAIKYLEISLELLDEIQQTGDIFFPKSWLDNTIGLYSSKEAYDILEEFIDTQTNFNPQLMMKLLQSTDNLYRAQRLLLFDKNNNN